MPMNVSLLDVLQFEGMEGGGELFDECVSDTPTVSGFDAVNNRQIPISVEEIDGDSYKSTVRVGLPELDPFRIANKGVRPAKGRYEQRITQLATSTSYWVADKSVIDKNPARGARYMEAEGQGIIRANMAVLEKQFFYGGVKNIGYKNGFQGLYTLCSDDMVIDAAGKGDALTSIWLVWWNPKGIQWLYGREGKVTLSEPKIVTAIDNDGGKFPAYEQYMEFYPGLACNNTKACLRIKNVDVSSVYSGPISAAAFTDLHVRRALAKFPTAMRPNVIYMPAAANLLLSASRTTIQLSNSRGGSTITGTFTPPIDNFDGIPIAYTDQILIGENPTEPDPGT